MEVSSEPDVDGGHAWVVLGAAIFSGYLLGLFYYSAGVVNTAVLEIMDEGVVKTSWVGSSMLGTLMLTGPLTGSLVHQLGCRTSMILGGLFSTAGLIGAYFSRNCDALIVTYGILVGFGTGLTATAGSVALGHYFARLRPLAAGIQISGGGFGMLSGAPLVRGMLDHYGLHGMFLILGGIAANACVAGALIRPSSYEKKLKTTSKRRESYGIRAFASSVQTGIKSFCLIFRECGFMMFVLSFSLWSFGESAYQVHLLHYVELKGTPPQKSPMLFTTMGIASTIARLLTGFAASDPGIGTLILYIGCLGLAGVVVMLIPVMSTTYSLQLGVCALYGLYAGAPMTLLNPVTVQLLGVENLAYGYGMAFFLSGVGLLLGPPFTGLLFDSTGNFDISYIVAGGIIVFGSVVAMFIVVLVDTTEKTPDSILDLTIEGPKEAHIKDSEAASDEETARPMLGDS